MRMFLRGGAALTAFAILAACGSKDAGAPSSTPGGEPRQVNVTLTVAGCDPTSLSLPAGPTTFNVANQDAPAVTEFEIKDGEQIIGEKENIVAGITGSFSLNLVPGQYTLACPGGTTAPTGTLEVVAASGSSVGVSPTGSTTTAQTAVAAYRAYVVAQSDTLVNRVRPFTQAVENGDIAKAKSLFAWAREPYEAIEPIAESFGDLDPEIDARENDVPAGEWTGFHRIEKALWVDGSLAGMTPMAVKLRADVNKLDTLVQTVSIDAAQIANGSTELLGEVSKSKITGEEDRYSHTDLWDFQANVDGARAGFTALEPLLRESDPQLADQIKNQFRAVDRALDPYRRGDGFVLYDELTDADTRALSQSIDALAEPLSLVAGAVVGA
jgi:iron uptake system component EfeO